MFYLIIIVPLEIDMRSRYGRYILGIVATIVAMVSTNECSAQEFGIYPEEERKVRT